MDSLTKFGPITTSLVLGEVRAVVWPFWRIKFWSNVEKEQELKEIMSGKRQIKSEVLTSEQVYKTYTLNR